MATISTAKNGCRRLMFSYGTKRHAVYLGRIAWRKAVRMKLAVEDAIEAKLTGSLPSLDTQRFFLELDRKAFEKFARTGIIEGRSSKQLKDFLAYCQSVSNVEPSTVLAQNQAVRSLTAFFGPDRAIADITPGDVDDFRHYLETRARKDNTGLSRATVTKRMVQSRQFFEQAVRKRWLLENPFRHCKGWSYENPARQYFVDTNKIEAVMQFLPDEEWKLLFALCRWAGLRCPSEVMALRWCDVNWEKSTILIHAAKTKRYRRRAVRTIPIFWELRSYLDAAWDAAADRSHHVITKHRLSNQALANHIKRACCKADIEPWPKFFQNLRSTRQTELIARGYSVHLVCAWIGNSPQIAHAHYLQVRESDYQIAASRELEYKLSKSETTQQTTQPFADSSKPTHKTTH